MLPRNLSTKLDVNPIISSEIKGSLILDQIESIFEHIHQSPMMRNPETIANIFTILGRETSEVFISGANCKGSFYVWMSGIDSSFSIKRCRILVKYIF